MEDLTEVNMPLNEVHNYLALIKNSCGSRMFRNLYWLDENGIESDILENGNLGCGFFVSAILKLSGRIPALHATVKGTVKEMMVCGWQEVEMSGGCDGMKEGDVLVWGALAGGIHDHIGFYIGEKMAISNSSENGMPIRHDYDFSGLRKVEKVLRWREDL